ncbi:MAG: hypothetical protein ACI8Z5_000597 [Lentimonas sp.]|jgi:hypothetical protein
MKHLQLSLLVAAAAAGSAFAQSADPVETFGGFNAMVEGETLSRLGGDHADIHPLDDAGDGIDFNQYWIGDVRPRLVARATF